MRSLKCLQQLKKMSMHIGIVWLHVPVPNMHDKITMCMLIILTHNVIMFTVNLFILLIKMHAIMLHVDINKMKKNRLFHHIFPLHVQIINQ